MRFPCVVGAALDHDLAGFYPRFAAFEDERYLPLQQADDIERVGLVHPRMARLVNDVPFSANRGKGGAGGGVERGFGHAGRGRLHDEPADLNIAGARAEDRSAIAAVAVVLWVERAGSDILPYLEQPADIRITRAGRRATVEDNDRLPTGIVSGDDAAHYGFEIGHGFSRCYRGRCLPHVSNYCADTLLALNISEKIEVGYCLVNVRFP
jgi:hypothetical protein